MRPRALVIGIVAVFAVMLLITLTPSATPPLQTAKPMSAAQKAQVPVYLMAHPQTVPVGWQRGILVSSEKNPQNTLFGSNRWTWSGNAITQDGTVWYLESDPNMFEIFDIVHVGDEFLWQDGSHRPSYSDQVKVLHQNVFTPQGN